MGMRGHRIILTGGGTGGHIYPALAVAERLQEDPDVEDILYIGAEGKLEERLAKERGLKFIGLRVSGLPRRFSLRLARWPFEFAFAVMAALKAQRAFRPTAVLGTGGYAAAPPLVAARMAGIPYAVHEPDAHPGLVNRALSRGASLVSLGMEAAASQLRPERGAARFNGNPVSRRFVEPLSREAAAAVLGIDPSLKTVVVTGGSQGAQALNEALVGALPALLEAEPKMQILHQAGEKNLQLVKERLDAVSLQSPRYQLRAYFDDLSLAYAVADIAVCRAGAMTVSELAVSGTPAIFVPYPFAAADHQSHNAQYVESKGAAIAIAQELLSSDSLFKAIVDVLGDDERWRAMRQSMRALGKATAAEDLSAQLKQLSAARMKRSPSHAQDAV